MPQQIVGQADIADPAVRHLIEPGVRPVLARLRLRDRYVGAVWVGDTPVAAAAARIEHDLRRAEIISLGALAQVAQTPALGLAIGHVRGTLNGAGLAVVFDPEEPVNARTEEGLRQGGMRPDGPKWQWFQLHPDRVDPQLRAAGPRQEYRVVDLATADPDQLRSMRERGQYRPHPGDLPQYSPVVLDTAGNVAALVIVRGTRAARLIHWSWVDPEHRKRALILTVGNAMLDLMERDGSIQPLRGKADVSNSAILHVLSGIGTDVMPPTFTTQTWVAVSNR